MAKRERVLVLTGAASFTAHDGVRYVKGREYAVEDQERAKYLLATGFFTVKEPDAKEGSSDEGAG